MNQEVRSGGIPPDRKEAAIPIIDLQNPQVILDLYFLAKTDVADTQRGLDMFYKKFASSERNTLLQSFVQEMQQGSPLTFMYLVEKTVDTQSAQHRRSAHHEEHTRQWEAWRSRVYREYPPVLFPGEDGHKKWEQAVTLVDRNQHPQEI